MPRQSLSYGQIADAILPSIVLSVRDRDALKGAVEDFVSLDSREHQAFFREQMGRIWSTSIDWKARPQEKSFLEQWSVRAPVFLVQRPGIWLTFASTGVEKIL